MKDDEIRPPVAAHIGDGDTRTLTFSSEPDQVSLTFLQNGVIVDPPLLTTVTDLSPSLESLCKKGRRHNRPFG